MRTLDRSPTLPLRRPRVDDIVQLKPQPEDCQRAISNYPAVAISCPTAASTRSGGDGEKPGRRGASWTRGERSIEIDSGR